MSSTIGPDRELPEVEKVMANIRGETLEAFRGQDNRGDSEAFRYLALNYRIPKRPDLSRVVSNRRGLIGKLITSFKKRALVLVWGLFSDYFEKEEAFRSQLIQYLESERKKT